MIEGLSGFRKRKLLTAQEIVQKLILEGACNEPNAWKRIKSYEAHKIIIPHNVVFYVNGRSVEMKMYEKGDTKLSQHTI